MGEKSISNLITEFAVNTDFDDLPADPVYILKLSLLDWCAVSIAGRNEPVSKIVRELVLSEGGNKHSFLFGSDRYVPMRAAALANGSTSHALDYDDTHFLHVGHTSVAILPAAFAVAEFLNLSGRDILTAALIGSEAACRIGDWLGRSHYNNGFHQTATAGTFGATIAAGRLLKLNHGQMLNAIGIASTKAAGLKNQFGTMGKPFNAGMAAASGVEAALLASKGFQSCIDGLECEQGFAATHYADPNRSVSSYANLGKDYVFVDVQHKFHACCHGLHATIEALQQIKEKHSFAPEQVSSVEIQINPRWLKVCDKKAPKTGLEAKFSFGLVSAMALKNYDTAALTTFCDEVCFDAGLIALRDQVCVSASDDISDTAANVSITLNNGDKFHQSFDLTDPIPIKLREEKILSKASALIGGKTAKNLWSGIRELETVSVRHLVGQIKQAS